MAGTHDLEQIDLITRPPSSEEFPDGKVALIICHYEPWSDAPEDISHLVEKINNYLVLSVEHLPARFPEDAGLPVRVQIDCSSLPSSTSTPMYVLREADIALRSYRARLSINVVTVD